MKIFKKYSFLLSTLLSLIGIFVLGALVACSNGDDSASSDSDGASIRGSTGKAKSVSVDITATSDGGVAKFGSSTRAARTILPGNMGGAALDYYLIYSEVTGSGNGTETGEKVAFTATDTDDTKGTVTKTFDVKNYVMFLYAVKSDASNPTGTLNTTQIAKIKSDAVLSGAAAIDLRYTTKLAFYLTANNIAGKGSFDIGIVTDWAIPSGYTVTAGVYDSAGALKFPSTVTPPASSASPQSLNVDATTNKLMDPANTAVNKLTNTSFDSGTYIIKVMFTPAGSTDKKFVYNDTLVVMANAASEGTIKVPNILDATPVPPADFVAGYIKPKNDTDNFYTVQFGWSNTSNNETGFQIDLLRMDDTDPAQPSYPDLPSGDTDWAALKTKYAPTAAKVFDSAYIADTTTNGATAYIKGVEAWAADINSVEYLTLTVENIGAFQNTIDNTQLAGTDRGGLGAKSNHVSIHLPLGHRFTARIRTMSDAGGSRYVYLTLPNDNGTVKTHADIAQGGSYTTGNAQDVTGTAPSTTPTSYTAAAAATQRTLALTQNGVSSDVTAFDAGVTTLNLYRIKYEAGDGAVYKKDASTALTAGSDTATCDILTTTYKSQHTDITGVTDSSPLGVASTTSVALLTPDANFAASVSGTSNTTEMCGNTTALNIELKKGASYWKEWHKDSISGDVQGTAATQVAASNPGIYTKYDNLTLFAFYGGSSGTSSVSGNVSIENPNSFELKTTFISYGTYTGTATTPNNNITPDTPVSFSKAAATNVVMSLDASAAKYTPGGANAVPTPINYDAVKLVVTRANGGDAMYSAESTDVSKVFDVKVDSNFPNGNYLFTFIAYKGHYQYQMTQVFSVGD